MKQVNLEWRDVARLAIILLVSLCGYFMRSVDVRLRNVETTVIRMDERIKSVENYGNSTAVNKSNKSNRLFIDDFWTKNSTLKENNVDN